MSDLSDRFRVNTEKINPKRIDRESLTEFSNGSGDVAIFDRSTKQILYYGFREEFIDTRSQQEKAEAEDDNYLMENFGWNANTDHGHVLLRQASTEMRVPRTRTLRRYSFHKIDPEPKLEDLDQNIAKELAAYQTAGASAG